MWLFMILIFGLRSARSVIAVVPLDCRHCNVRADQRVVQRVLRLTVFFIPILPVWTSYLLQCSNCATETKVSAERAERAAEWALGPRR